MHWDMHMQNTCTVILLRYSSISNWDLQTRGKERECAFYISSVCHAFGSRSPARLLPRCEDPSRHHRRVPPPPCLVLLLPPHLLLPPRGDGAPLEDSGSSTAWMPRWSSAVRVTCASAASTVFGSTQAFLVAVGLAALTRLGVAAMTSALTVLGVVLPVLAVAVSPCRARGRGCDESEVEAFELCVLLSQAPVATVSLWSCHRRARPPAPRILPPRMEAWPDDFPCPISLEVMTDPVILPSGHIFERRSIQHWLNGGTSPAPSPTSRCRRPCRSSPTTRSAAL
jgi:hypothetical protein